MRTAAIVATVVLAGTMTLEGSARAADAAGPGIELGVRTGYAIGLGNVAQNDAMSDAISGMIPLWADFGYRSPEFFLGGYAMYGFGFLGGKSSTSCSQNGTSCGGVNVVMYGLQAHYHFSPDGTFDPWVGYGIGFENNHINISQGGQSISGGDSGIDYAIFQLGGDYKVMPNLGIGPVVMFALGQYQNASISANGQSQSQSIQNQDFHEWLTIGVRGAYDIVF